MGQRAWPFENVPEGGGRIRTPQDYAARREGCDAIIVRIGLNDTQLVLVDGEGGWDRWVYSSVDEAQGVAESLGIPVHVGEYPEAVRVRMNARRRTAAEFDRGAYPEVGRVGPTLPYPENRPRRVGREKQAPPGTDRGAAG
jgi:hypothetical protein